MVDELFKTGNYEQIIVSNTKDCDTLDSGIFEGSLEARDYIFQQLVKP